MSTASHGGYCCGVKHIYGFPYESNPERRKLWLESEMEEILDDLNPRKSHGQLIEVCLTDSQSKTWAPLLKEKGFRHVARWRNSNSGNVVNMFLYQPRVVRAKRPFEF